MTSDLLLVMSNLYSLDNGSLRMSSKVNKSTIFGKVNLSSLNSQRMFASTPLVKLGGKEFKKVKDFLYR